MLNRMCGEGGSNQRVCVCVFSMTDSASVLKTAEVATAVGVETTTGATRPPAAYVSKTLCNTFFRSTISVCVTRYYSCRRESCQYSDHQRL